MTPERIAALVSLARAIDERDPDKPSAWLYSRYQLIEMAESALAYNYAENTTAR